MDANTLILTLAFGSFVFGFLLILFQYGKEPSRRIPFWVPAKFLQGTGSLILYSCDIRTPSPLNLAANALLLLGCAYEGWAVFHLTGRTVSRRLHLSVAGGITSACLLMVVVPPFLRLSLNFLIHTFFYVLPGWALLYSDDKKSLLRVVLGYSFLLVAGVFLTRSLWILIVPALSFTGFGAVLNQIMLPLVFCMMLISGYSLLLLAKENSDRGLQEALWEDQAILDTLPTGLGILRDRIIIRCNPALEQTFGFAPGTLAGNHISCLYASQEECAQYGQIIYDEIKRNRRFNGEILGCRQNGELFWSWVEGTAIFSERPGRQVVFSITDITAQKQQQELLSRQKEELDVALKANVSFVAMVSHEYRTPLAIIRGNLDILALLEGLNEDSAFAVGKMKGAVARLAEILEVSLGRVRLANDTLKLYTETLAVAEVCAAVLKQATEYWPDRHFVVSTSAATATVTGDAVLLKTAILNLLDNAVKYSPSQMPVLLEWRPEEKEAIITVSDRGPGIMSGELERLEDKYFRGSASSGTVGAGIGLWLVARIVEEHRGTVRFEPGEPGLAVTIRLPLITQEPDHV